ncbi:MAG: PIN domain-containing protein [Bacteroidia bacterium]
MAYIIFIDTNIFLDFYRIRNSDAKLEYLEQIEKNLDVFITSSQVEMEYKKNRQAVILDTIKNHLKMPDLNSLNTPPILMDSVPSKNISKKKKEIATQYKKLTERINNILKKPSYYDPVYKSLQKLFKHKSPLNLDRTNKVRVKIRNLAKKRFLLGYPPRKKDDTSIGDSINWEWLINCAETTNKNIIIVSRDNDFGTHHSKESFLNDWLIQEFKERVSRRRQIIFTDRLSVAFKTAKIKVSKNTEKVEEELVSVENIEKKVKETRSDEQGDFFQRMKIYFE